MSSQITLQGSGLRVGFQSDREGEKWKLYHVIWNGELAVRLKIRIYCNGLSKSFRQNNIKSNYTSSKQLRNPIKMEDSSLSSLNRLFKVGGKKKNRHIGDVFWILNISKPVSLSITAMPPECVLYGIEVPLDKFENLSCKNAINFFLSIAKSLCRQFFRGNQKCSSVSTDLRSSRLFQSNKVNLGQMCVLNVLEFVTALWIGCKNPSFGPLVPG